MEYIQVGMIHEASHWIPQFDKNYKYSLMKKVYMLVKCLFNGTKFSNDVRFTLGKHYPLFISGHNNRLVIIDDNGKECETYLKHKGYFIKEEI